MLTGCGQPLVIPRKFAFQGRIHLTPAEAFRFEGAQWIIVLELLIFLNFEGRSRSRFVDNRRPVK